MSGGQIMVVLIVAMVMVASIIKSRHGGRAGRFGRDGQDAAIGSAEAQRLREEVARLKERLATLERIAVEKESSLDRQIEELRSR